MPRQNLDDAILEASLACCEVYIAHGTTRLTVEAIAIEIGISQRTFYRYFPIKAQSVKPLFDWTSATFNAAVASAPTGTIEDVLGAAFRQSLGGDVAERTRRFFPILFADGEMWSVFLQAVHFGETSLAPALAARLGVDAGSDRARVAAAAVATATRLALEDLVATGRDPQAAFDGYVRAFAAGFDAT